MSIKDTYLSINAYYVYLYIEFVQLWWAFKLIVDCRWALSGQGFNEQIMQICVDM